MAAVARPGAASAQAAPAAREASGNWPKAASAAARSPRSSAAPIRATGGSDLSLPAASPTRRTRTRARMWSTSRSQPLRSGGGAAAATAGSTFAQLAASAESEGAPETANGFSGGERFRADPELRQGGELRRERRGGGEALFEAKSPSTATEAALSDAAFRHRDARVALRRGAGRAFKLGKAFVEGAESAQSRLGGGETAFEFGETRLERARLGGRNRVRRGRRQTPAAASALAASARPRLVERRLGVAAGRFERADATAERVERGSLFAALAASASSAAMRLSSARSCRRFAVRGFFDRDEPRASVVERAGARIDQPRRDQGERRAENGAAEADGGGNGVSGKPDGFLRTAAKPPPPPAASWPRRRSRRESPPPRRRSPRARVGKDLAGRSAAAR